MPAPCVLHYIALREEKQALMSVPSYIVSLELALVYRKGHSMRKLTPENPYACTGTVVASAGLNDAGEHIIGLRQFASGECDTKAPVYDFGDLFNGMDFLNDARTGYIIEYDGTLGCVIVDGMASNIGLSTDSFSAGAFLLEESAYEKLCQEHKVEVLWFGR